MKTILDRLESLKAEVIATGFTPQRSRLVERIDAIIDLVWDELAPETDK